MSHLLRTEFDPERSKSCAMHAPPACALSPLSHKKDAAESSHGAFAKIRFTMSPDRSWTSVIAKPAAFTVLTVSRSI